MLELTLSVLELTLFAGRLSEGEFKHDVGTNVKQMNQWKKLYTASSATVPECWPKKVKHDGHTISVSDVWFIGHHLGSKHTHRPAPFWQCICPFLSHCRFFHTAV